MAPGPIGWGALRHRYAGVRLLGAELRHGVSLVLEELRDGVYGGLGSRSRALHALRVGYYGRGPGFFGPFPAAPVQAGADPLPRSVDSPLGKYQ